MLVAFRLVLIWMHSTHQAQEVAKSHPAYLHTLLLELNPQMHNLGTPINLAPSNTARAHILRARGVLEESA
jgi:hypothetical protein